MRLTVTLQRFNRLPNGHLFRGKTRLVKEVKPPQLRQLREEYALEEKNMFYLRFPYLTENQSRGHAKALGKQIKYKEKFSETSRRIFADDVTLGERLLHFRCSESWDE